MERGEGRWNRPWEPEKGEKKGGENGTGGNKEKRTLKKKRVARPLEKNRLRRFSEKVSKSVDERNELKGRGRAERIFEEGGHGKKHQRR